MRLVAKHTVYFTRNDGTTGVGTPGDVIDDITEDGAELLIRAGAATQIEEPEQKAAPKRASRKKSDPAKEAEPSDEGDVSSDDQGSDFV